MAQKTFSIRMDDKLKKEFESLCNEFGMNLSTAINIYARSVVREKRIPFEIISVSEYQKQQALKNFEEMRNEYYKKGGKELTLDEINEEIKKARRGEK